MAPTPPTEAAKTRAKMQLRSQLREMESNKDPMKRAKGLLGAAVTSLGTLAKKTPGTRGKNDWD